MEKLDAWFDDLNKLIQDIFISHKHLSIVREERKHKKFLNEDFFSFYQYQQWFMLNIQLAKIFENKKTQKRNVGSLFNGIIKGDFSDELKPFLNDITKNKSGLNYEQFIDKIKELNSLIKTHEKIIAKISNARNKIYAHTDIDRIINFPTVEEIKTVTELAAHLYNKSRGLLYDKHMDFTHGINNLTLNFIIKVIDRRTEKKLHNENA